MKKQNDISYETVRSLFSEDDSDGASFKFNGAESNEVLRVPKSLMHRLYRLGQAYGMRHLRYLESDVKIIVGTPELQSFSKDLSKLRALLNDEVLHEYIDKILHATESATIGSIGIATPNYFEKYA